MPRPPPRLRGPGPRPRRRRGRGARRACVRCARSCGTRARWRRCPFTTTAGWCSSASTATRSTAGVGASRRAGSTRGESPERARAASWRRRSASAPRPSSRSAPSTRLPASATRRMHLFRATGLTSVPPRPEDDERIETGTFTLDDAREMIAPRRGARGQDAGGPPAGGRARGPEAPPLADLERRAAIGADQTTAWTFVTVAQLRVVVASPRTRPTASTNRLSIIPAGHQR